MHNKQLLILALGCNIEQKTNMQRAKKLLTEHWTGIIFSTEAWTLPVGMASDRFLNCVAMLEVSDSLEDILHYTKSIELACGNTPSARKNNEIAMDIDVLLFNKRRFHKKDWNRDYIIEMLNEIGFNER